MVREKVASIPTGTTIGTSPVSAGPPPMPVSRLTFFFVVIGCLVLAVAPLPAAESEFTSTLSVQQLMAAGLIGQTTAERDILNRMVAEEGAFRGDGFPGDGQSFRRPTVRDSLSPGFRRP